MPKYSKEQVDLKMLKYNFTPTQLLYQCNSQYTIYHFIPAIKFQIKPHVLSKMISEEK